MTELVNFIFHIIRIFNFRHKLAFKQVVRFKRPSVKLNHCCFLEIDGHDEARRVLIM